MGRDVLSSKLKFTTPDDDVYEGEIPEQRWLGPQYALEDLGVIDAGVHSRPMGDYRIDFDVNFSTSLYPTRPSFARDEPLLIQFPSQG